MLINKIVGVTLWKNNLTVIKRTKYQALLKVSLDKKFRVRI